MQIEIEVTGQKIKRLNSPGSVADTLNYLTCHFIFVGEEWGNTVRTAYFENQKSGERYAQIIADDGTCTVPWEALTDKGFVRFSVAGEREDYRITTDVESFYNSGTIYGGNPSEPPTSDQYDQMIALAEQTKEIAESVRRDADEGKFDGDPGEPGKPGKPGDPGRDGVSPTAKVEQTDDGAVITITDAAGTTTAELKNGKEGNPGQNATDEQVRGAVDAYMEEHPVQVDTDDLIKIAIKEEASGAAPIVITDSAEMGVQDLTMQGWTEQDSYEGNQLFDSTEVEFNKMLNVGTGNVNAGDNSDYSVSPYIPVKPNTTYSRTYNSILGNCVYDSDKRFISNVAGEGTIVTPENAAFLRFNLPSGVDFAEAMMVNEGSTLLPWEPYTGGQPSPNPDYPQKIVNAGAYDEEGQKYEYGLKLTGKNMLPPDWNPGAYWYIPIHGFVIGETYTASQQNAPEAGENFYVSIGTYAGNANVGTQYWLYHKSSGSLIRESVSWVATQEVYYLNVSDISGFGNGISVDSTKLDKFLELFPDLMVEMGAERTEYAPYQEQSVHLTSDRPLTKWDRLEKRNGQWGWVYKSGVKQLTSDMSIYKNLEGTYQVASFAKIDRNRLAESLSTHFIYKLSTKEYGNFWFDSVGTDLRFRMSQFNTAEEVKDWLQENEVYFAFPTTEETFAPLSESEQEAMNALHTFRPTTVLDNDQGCEMSVQYIADTRAYIDKKISAIQAAIVNAI